MSFRDNVVAVGWLVALWCAFYWSGEARGGLGARGCMQVQGCVDFEAVRRLPKGGEGVRFETPDAREMRMRGRGHGIGGAVGGGVGPQRGAGRSPIGGIQGSQENNGAWGVGSVWGE